MAVIIDKVKHMKFLLDSMLGRLAKWLRIMGYDVHYQSKYKLNELYLLAKQDRIFVTRNSKLAGKLKGILLKSNNMTDQFRELRTILDLKVDPDKCFSRCIVCNTELKKAEPEHAKDYVPEYVFILNKDKIKYCPSCNRFYWPGTHKKRMFLQLKNLIK